MWKHERDAHQAALSADGKRAAAVKCSIGSSRVFQWNAENGQALHGCLQGNRSHRFFLRFTADERLLVSGPFYVVLLCEVLGGNLLRTLKLETEIPER